MKKFIFVFICLLPIFTCQGQIITVDDDGPAGFKNIQDAINASQDGDIVIVKPGNYNENIFFNSRAIIISSEDPNNPSVVQSTIITTTLGYGITFDFAEGSDSVLTGFTITGRGILCHATSPTILKNIIKDCESNGIRGENEASPMISHNTIIFNNQAGVYQCNGPITNNTISRNNGSGIANCNGSIINNNISGNSNNSPGFGGGLRDCDGQISSNVIENNYAAFNGGAFYGCDGNINDNIIVGNRTDFAGGGLSSCHGDINNNIITGNSSQNGGGLYSCGDSIYNNTIVGNRAAQNGGGLNNCTGTVFNNIIAFNEASFIGGIFGPCSNSYNAFWFNIVGNFGGGATPGPGDFLANPFFATEGFWDSNDTPDQSDDFWSDGDYHVKSERGRWNPNSQIWVKDDVTSPCVDAGDPNSDWIKELWPHGKRINLGVYGNTPQTSMSLSEVGNIADLNLNGRVDYNDIKLLIDKWLSNEVLLAEDLNRDRAVDFTDFAILADNWQPPLPPPSPPIPNPMTWAIPPHATSPHSVAMVATTAISTDSSGVEYFFEDFDHPTFNSGWLSFAPGQEPRWQDSDLTPLTTFRYRVKARNKANRLETDWSEVASVTTPTDDTTPPTPDPMQWAEGGEPKEIQLGPGPFDFFATMTAAEATDESGVVEYFFESTTEPRFSSSWQTERTYTVPVGRANQGHRFRVKARDLFGNETGWSPELPALP
jgi:hypothetical protein